MLFTRCHGGGIWNHILIPEGNYDIEKSKWTDQLAEELHKGGKFTLTASNRVIQQKIKQNGHAANVTISANTTFKVLTLKAVLILENNYHVDFRPDHSVCSLLGFNHDVYCVDLRLSKI